MTDAIEELEPLFDYTRVQPLNFVCLDDDDDDDCSTVVPAKRRKPSASAVDKVQVTPEAIVIDDGEDNGDLDWLEAPPPKVPVNKEKLCENSIIKELRQKRQELLSFTESTDDMVRTVEENVKRDLKTSTNLEPESPIEKHTKPVVERPKIVISIQDKDGPKQFRVYKDDKFERLFKMYADKVKNKVENLVFCFDGDKIDPSATPSSLEMEDDDMIEVHVKSN
ncbi:putative Rad60/SUMO-like domain, Ubiquitin-like domain superfamily [Helianthus annuus]|nr:putative Rad60/SUMO-like domain, Ubiquitin-like domain superfamily [Helianthus annuus]